MSWMIKKPSGIINITLKKGFLAPGLHLAVFLMFFSSFPVSVFGSGPASGLIPVGMPAELVKLQEKFEAGILLQARLSHEFQDSYTGEIQRVEGWIWVYKDKYRIETEHQVLLIDGTISRVYNRQQNTLLISDYDAEDDDFAPSRFFNLAEERYQVSDVQRDRDMVRVEIEALDPFDVFTNVTIVIQKNLVPVEVFAVDQMQNSMRTIFKQASFHEYDASFFQYAFPDDAEIIDLR